MNLRSKLLLMGFLAIFAQAFILYAFYDYELAPRISQLEKTLVEKNLHRNVELVQRELFHIERLTLLLSGLPIIQNIITSTSDLKVSSEKLKKIMIQQELNSIFILDKSDKVLWESILDLNIEQPYPNQGFLPALSEAAPSFFDLSSTQSLLAGIYNSPLGPALMVCAPIVLTSKPNTVHGTLIVGRLITQEVLQLIQSLTFTEMKLWPLAGAKLSTKHLEIIHEIQKGDSDFLIEKTKNAYRGYMSLPELSQKGHLLISTLQSQDFTQMFESSLFKVGLILILLELLFLATLIFYIRRLYVEPTRKLVEQIEYPPESWLAPQTQLKPGTDAAMLAIALAHFMVKQQSHLNQETNSAYRQGLYNARQELCQGLEETLRLTIDGIEWMEKKLSNLPTNDIEWIIAQSKTGPLSPELEHEVEKLQNINEGLRLYQKEIRAKLYFLHNKSLRNAAILRTQSRSHEPTKQFTQITTYSQEDKKSMTRS